MDSSKRFALVACALFVAFSIFALLATHKLPPSSFKAFYCAGESLLHRGDPYEVEPLRACEHRVAPGELPAYAVEPAPLPGYALLPWSAVALLPPQTARALFAIVLSAALVVTAAAIAAIASLDLIAVAVALLALWYLNVSFGEIPPIAVAGIAFSALMLRRDRPWAAAAGAGVAAIEPHLAVPLWLSMALFAPRTRLPLLVAGVALLLLDVAAGGPRTAWEFATVALPAQARSEIFAADQFSLTHVLAIAGVKPAVALLAGTLSYAIMMILGIAVARRLSAGGAHEYLALVPPAFALLGGTFLHDLQFLAAMPLALVLLGRSRSMWMPALAAALLAVAWSEATSRLALLVSAASIFAVVWLALPRRSDRVVWSAAAAVAAAALVVALAHVPGPASGSVPAAGASSVRASDSAGRDWEIYLESDSALTTSSPRSLMRKIPTWAGVLLLLAGTLAVAAPVPRQLKAS